MKRFTLLALALPMVATAQTYEPIQPNADSEPAALTGGWTIPTTGGFSCDSTGNCPADINNLTEGSIGPWVSTDGFYGVGQGFAPQQTVSDLLLMCTYNVSLDVQGVRGDGPGALPMAMAFDIATSPSAQGLSMTTDSNAAWETVGFAWTPTATSETISFSSPGGSRRYVLIDNLVIAPDASDPDCGSDPVTPPSKPAAQLHNMGAINTYRFTREHIAARLDATQQQTGTYLQQFSGNPRDGSGARWTTVHLSQLDGHGADGLFAATTAAWDLSERDNSLFGALVGAEYGDYSVGAAGVQKIGLSGGIYGGAKLGGSALVEGHLTYTYFQNEVSGGGLSTTVPSQRLLGHVSLSAGLGQAGGFAINPYLEADYAQERMDAYSIGGINFAAQTVTTGLASLGVELTTGWNTDYGQFYGKLQADQAFGNDPALTNDEVTGTLGLGWFSNTSYDSIGRIEINASGLGGSGVSETRAEGHWERNF